MKKSMKYYIAAWFIFLLIFNVVVFAVPSSFSGNKFNGAFWIGYIFVLVSFIGQLACAFSAFKAEKKEEFFLNLPLITMSYSFLIISTIFGALIMLLPGVPNWIAAIICVLFLGCHIIALLKASAAADISASTGAKIKEQAQFIKLLAADMESLMARAAAPEAKVACRKVFDTIRYSDPMSREELGEIETDISEKYMELKEAVERHSANVPALAEEMAELLGERNRKCRLLK